MLPRASGMEVLEKTRHLTSARILVVTMFHEDSVIRKAFELGADCVFPKDDGLDAFKKIVGETLEGECSIGAATAYKLF